MNFKGDGGFRIRIILIITQTMLTSKIFFSFWKKKIISLYLNYA